MRIRQWLAAALLLITQAARASIPIPFSLDNPPDTVASEAWPVLPPLPAPDGLRPCCAFGYNLSVRLFGVPLPFYRINNIARPDHLGRHHYNDSSIQTLLDVIGLGREHNGILYSQHGGFIDTAHIRDSADMTLYLFSQIYPRLGQGFTLRLTDELARRELVFFPFSPPDSPAQRYSLASWLAARLAFQIAAWHEVAQWYGFQSVPGFSEGISAFSPEDLYSNLLGARIAATLILDGHAASLSQYEAAMDILLPQALTALGAQPASQTRQQFDKLDQRWWNSHCAVPEKFLLLKRNYHTADDRLPSLPASAAPQAWRLSLPVALYGYPLAQLAQFRLLPTDHLQQLPAPKNYYTAADFPSLARHAKQQDDRRLNHSRQCR